MTACNVVKKELGGKDLLLKVCVPGTYSTTITVADITSTAHGLKIGDIVSFLTVGTVTTISVGVFYYVKAVTTDTFTVSETKTGDAIVMDQTQAALSINFFRATGGLRSKSMSFSSESVDITSEDSDEWVTLLDKAGVRSMEISGSGVYNNYTVFQGLVTKFLSNDLACMAFIEAKTGRIYSGCFKISSLEVSGEYNAESSYSISASSSGEVVTAVIADA